MEVRFRPDKEMQEILNDLAKHFNQKTRSKTIIKSLKFAHKKLT